MPVENPATSLKISSLIPTVFHEPWWLEIVGCDVVEVESGGKTIGRLPYLLSRRMGFTYIATPPITHFLGPAIDEGEGNVNTRFLKRRSITRDLIDKLPAVSLVKIKCHRGIKDAIAFQEENFKVSVQFTCEVHPASEEVLWRGMRDKTRNVVRRSQETLLTDRPAEVEEFLGFYQKNLDARDLRSHLDLTICKKLIVSSVDRGCGKIYTARKQGGTIAAAIFCVWDAQCAYYLMATDDRESHNGAISLLIWEAVKDATQRNIIFDFDGLHNRGSALLYGGFSANMQPRFVANRSSNFLMKSLWDFRDRNKETSFFH